MTRRPLLIVATAALLVGLAAVGLERPRPLLTLDWARKAGAAAPPVAVLIEMGLKDIKPTTWSGRAEVNGAKVIDREGYRFRKEDRLKDPNAWTASSHRPYRAPAGKPAVVAAEGMASVGVVLYLRDVAADAVLTIHGEEGERMPAIVPLQEVVAGKAHQIWGGAGVVRLISTAGPVTPGKTEDDYPAACYAPDGTLWVAYVAYHVKEESRRIEPPKLEKQPENFKDYDTPEFGDQVLVKSFKDGKWSEPLRVTEAKEDIVRCAIAAEGSGTVWVIYSAQRGGKHRVHARPIEKGALGAEVLAPGQEKQPRNVSPVSCTDRSGAVRVAFQSWTDQGAWIGFAQCEKGKWTASGALRTGANCWHAALAAGPRDVVAAFDTYDGDYDVVLARPDAGLRDMQDLATSAAFEARPSAVYDPDGRLWIAYELGPENWGKDFGALDDKNGNPLYFQRTIRVVCVQDGKLMRPVAELPALAPRLGSPDTGVKAERMRRLAYPQVGIDGKGRVWLTYRESFASRYNTAPGAYWLTFAQRLEGDHWSEPIEIHHSDGLLDHRPVLLPHAAGGLTIIHNTDGRLLTPDAVNNRIYMSYVDLPGEPAEPKLVPHEAGRKSKAAVARAEKEAAAVKAIRAYRVEAGGKTYRLLRGEFHRHTEISWDGGPDGSLEDMFRYAIDAAGMDWIGNGDHDNGAGREYSWWLTQKLTDAYLNAGRFTPMFSYERSAPYPHGHRNAIFARRGIRTLPRLAEPDAKKRVAGIHADDTKMFYRYLKELGGICASHTSATGMGTDWRDNDPVAEPIVELYQGDRMSYEMEGAPRAGYEAKSGKTPVNIAGWYPKGYINLALQKGYRLGFQSSSDHMSTHLSYCVALAESPDRDGILAALKKRHCYAATDDIILDVTSGDHVMGDEFAADKATLTIKVRGTGPLSKVHILRDSAIVKTYATSDAELNADWIDPAPLAGTHYYYVRVEQADGNLAWGSPLWIEAKR